jgi:hypothetical protein
MEAGRGWYSRGCLPHFDGGAAPQFLTWRLADTIPASRFDAWRRETDGLTEGQRKLAMYRAVEQELDRGMGACVLKEEREAGIVYQTLNHYAGELYDWRLGCDAKTRPRASDSVGGCRIGHIGPEGQELHCAPDQQRARAHRQALAA